jgi:hypothetical protein
MKEPPAETSTCGSRGSLSAEVSERVLKKLRSMDAFSSTGGKSEKNE